MENYSPSLKADVIKKVNRAQPNYKDRTWLCIVWWGH